MEIIKARLRKGKDDDIKEGLENLPAYYDRSDFIRDAVRLMLFGKAERTNYKEEYLSDIGADDNLELKRAEIPEDELEFNLDQILRGI